MRKYLLPENGNFYKANLHCHTTYSDGRLPPEQVKEAYMANGYSIVAYTDHDVLIGHNDLTDEKFLALNGFEIGINDPQASSWENTRAVHLCLIALSPENLTHPCWHRTKYLFANAVKYRDIVRYNETKPDFEKTYSPECVNKIIEEGRKNGFFVTYNHPKWSLETREEYSQYRDLHAMEICNYDSASSHGCEEYSPQIYDEMLRMGKKLFCIATDDNHNFHPKDSRRYDSFGAFTVIKTDALDYKSVTDAMLRGDFYASQGPEIYELYYEDGYVHITCSNADIIKMNTGVRHAVIVYDETGEGITKASFPVNDPILNYVRFTVIDKQGRRANTNAYFYKDLVSEENK